MGGPFFRDEVHCERGDVLFPVRVVRLAGLARQGAADYLS